MHDIVIHFFHIHLETGFDDMDIPTPPRLIGERAGIEYSTAEANSDEIAVLASLFMRGYRTEVGDDARDGCTALVVACKANDGGN